MLSDEAAFAAFYDRTSRALWAFVYRATGHAADADDIVSEAFCRFLQAAEREWDENERRRYLFRIAGNLVVDRWRRLRRDNEEPLREESPPSVGAAGGFDDVTAGFARLTEHDRVLLWLAYVEGHSHAEIAATVGVRTGSVKVLLARARERLRRLLGSTVSVL
jgi:RNA polymerase sigma-70 factor (ECF subfamily)